MTQRLKRITRESQLEAIVKRVKNVFCSSRSVDRGALDNSVTKYSRSFPYGGTLIVHASYHKMGSTWLANVLRAISKHYGLSFRQVNEDQEFDSQCDIVVVNHSDIIQGLDLDVRASHMVRDLRDVVVSGYFYHLWTEEAWARAPSPRFDNLSYQEYLRSLNQDDGLLAEIDFLTRYTRKRRIWEWDFTDPRYLEIKYEELFNNQEGGFQRMFSHYGFPPDEVTVCVNIATQFSFERVTKRKPGQESSTNHLRSGIPGQWKQHFKQVHIDKFKEQLGGLLIIMGYESDLNW
jgi:hypothetical protein